jgi:hypothetical protein
MMTERILVFDNLMNIMSKATKKRGHAGNSQLAMGRPM